MLYPEEGELRPIVIQRGPVRCHVATVKNCNTYDLAKTCGKSKRVDLILLTNALIVTSSFSNTIDKTIDTSPAQPKPTSTSNRTPLRLPGAKFLQDIADGTSKIVKETGKVCLLSSFHYIVIFSSLFKMSLH